MKGTIKAIMATAFLAVATSCTEQYMTREWGGEMEVKLPKGQKLLMATWKDAHLFYLTEPMDSLYVPKKKTLEENSSTGLWESKITFIESR